MHLILINFAAVLPDIYDVIIANIDAVINYVMLFLLTVFSLKLRLSRKLTLVLMLVYCVFVVAVSSVLGFLMQESVLIGNYMPVMLIPLLVFYFIIVEDSFSRILFVFFSLFTYTMFVDINTTMFALRINSGNPVVINIIIKSCLHALLFFPIHKYVSIPLNKVLGYVDKRHWYFLSLFPMLVCFITLLLSKEGFIALGNMEFIIVNAICIFSFCIYFMIYSLFKKTLRVMELQNDMTLAHNQLLLQREHYKQLSESVNNLKRMQHDTKYHYSTIRELARNNNNAGIIEYLNEILHRQPDYTLRTVCDNFAADAIIRHFVILAKSKDISVRMSKIHIPQDISIDSYDLSVILGNCLENAIEACDKLPDTVFKKLEISAMIANSYLIIKVSNSFDGNFMVKNGVIISHKGSDGHGLGIRNIRSVAEKYKGNVQIDTANNVFTVVAALLISSPSQQNAAPPAPNSQT